MKDKIVLKKVLLRNVNLSDDEYPISGAPKPIEIEAEEIEVFDTHDPAERWENEVDLLRFFKVPGDHRLYVSYEHTTQWQKDINMERYDILEPGETMYFPEKSNLLFRVYFAESGKYFIYYIFGERHHCEF